MDAARVRHFHHLLQAGGQLAMAIIGSKKPRGKSFLGVPGWCRASALMVLCCASPTQALAQGELMLPAPRPVPSVTAEAPATRTLPINLETIFRLAEEQNLQVRLARERISGACAELDVAGYTWLPRLYVGPAWYRHEGGIQNEDGTLTHSSMGALFGGTEIKGSLDFRAATYARVKAEREVWQQKAELSRITYETLQDAANTYMDLLTARTGEAIAQKIEERLQALLKQAEGLGGNLPQGPVEAIRAELYNHHLTALKMKQLASASSARLVYLLGLDPCTKLEPGDAQLAPLALVDATPGCDELVQRVMATGPGVRELEGMLGLLASSLDQANGPSRFLPVLEVGMLEGAFGAGVGASTSWDNRWDLGVQARWDLSSLITARDRKRAAESKLQQVHLTLQDLRGKLAAGVQEAKSSIQVSQEQVSQSQEHLRHADKSYQLLNEMLAVTTQKDRLVGDVLRSVLSIKEAQYNYLSAVSSFDKAQLRLLLLLGPGAGACPH
jgi:outer membrane protein TolC